MSVWHGRSRRKPTGGKYHPHRKRRKYERGRPPTMTKIGSVKREVIRVRGGNIKVRLYRIDYANVYDPGSGKYVKARIIRVLENPANSHYVQKGIITKGAVLETEVGRAVVTSRPGQHGVVNARLLT